jgi:hypothetical protein
LLHGETLLVTASHNLEYITLEFLQKMNSTWRSVNKQNATKSIWTYWRPTFVRTLPNEKTIIGWWTSQGQGKTWYWAVRHHLHLQDYLHWPPGPIACHKMCGCIHHPQKPSVRPSLLLIFTPHSCTVALTCTPTTATSYIDIFGKVVGKKQNLQLWVIINLNLLLAPRCGVCNIELQQM